MATFELLDRLAECAFSNNIPVYRIAMYKDGEIKERVVNPTNDCMAIYSVSKVFAATVCGLAYDDGKIGYDTTVWELFRDEYPDMNPLWKDVTLEVALSQTVGLGGMFLDIDCQNAAAWGKDWLKAVLDNPFVTKPGEKFAYSDSNFYLACRMAEKASGRRAQDMMSERFFDPLLFQGWAWATCPRGHVVGGSGLFVRTADIAKLGVVYMNYGEYEGQRILSREFCEKATSVISHPNEDNDYGLAFWLPKKRKKFKVQCGGMLNQTVRINREDGIVISWHSYDDRGVMGGKFDEILDA